MTREVPTSKPATLWRANGRWFQTAAAAYYALAKHLVLTRYPRWLDDNDLDESVEGENKMHGDREHGDNMADMDRIADWRARRERRRELFWRFDSDTWNEDRYEGFDVDKWQRFVRRVARFLAFVDRRRAELVMPRVAAIDCQHIRADGARAIGANGKCTRCGAAVPGARKPARFA